MTWGENVPSLLWQLSCPKCPLAPGRGVPSSCPLPVCRAPSQSLAATQITHRPRAGGALVHSDHGAWDQGSGAGLRGGSGPQPQCAPQVTDGDVRCPGLFPQFVTLYKCS